MKPRCDTEREVQRLHDKLKDPSYKQINWMVGQDKERILEDYKKSGRKVDNWSYYSIATTCRNWQVVRYYLLNSTCSRNGYAFGSLTEISQRWMRFEDGQLQLHIFEKPKVMNWQWHCQPYALDSDLTLKGWNTSTNRNGRTQFYMDDTECVPDRRISRDFRERGLANIVGRMDEIDLYSRRKSGVLMQAVEKYKPISRRDCKKLTERTYVPVRGETLCKMGLTQCGVRYISSPYMRRNIDRWWKSLLVAKRHGFDFSKLHDISEWFDYMEQLYVLGYDTHSPKYLCPADFNAEHARLTRKHNAILERERAERRRVQQLEDERRAEERAKRDREIIATYAGRMGVLLGLVITNSKFDIRPLQSVDEFKEEGDAMHHCVFSNRYYAKDYCLIMSARDKDGNRVETIEVNLQEFRINQSRGVNNQATEFHNDIVTLVESYMPTIKRLTSQRNKLAKKMALSA